MDSHVFCKRRHYRFPPAPRSSKTVDEQRGRSRAARDAVANRHAADLARSLLEHDFHSFLRRPSDGNERGMLDALGNR